MGRRKGRRKRRTGPFLDRTIEEAEMVVMATMPCCALSSSENLVEKTRFWRIVARMAWSSIAATNGEYGQDGQDGRDGPERKRKLLTGLFIDRTIEE